MERIEAERREITLDTPPLQSRAHSPVLRSIGDRTNSYQRRQQGVTGLGLTGSSAQLAERSRKPLAHMMPYRQDSLVSAAQDSSRGSIPETPPIHNENEELFDGVVSPATPERTINDMLSISTAAAGPSVQLVESLSSSVRSLRIDNGALKEELSRLSAERDESRAEVVSLLREVEAGNEAKVKILKLEKELDVLQKRYDTTLQLLGERVEEVSELQADIEDMKKIWRETISRSVTST